MLLNAQAPRYGLEKGRGMKVRDRLDVEVGGSSPRRVEVGISLEFPIFIHMWVKKGEKGNYGKGS